MKKTLLFAGIFAIVFMGFHGAALGQGENLNLIHITKLKTVMPEDGTFGERDSLIAIYNKNVIDKNDLILSHHEYAHFFTSNSQDYLIVSEYKSFSSWEDAVTKNGELEESVVEGALGCFPRGYRDGIHTAIRELGASFLPIAAASSGTSSATTTRSRCSSVCRTTHGPDWPRCVP